MENELEDHRCMSLSILFDIFIMLYKYLSIMSNILLRNIKQEKYRWSLSISYLITYISKQYLTKSDCEN